MNGVPGWQALQRVTGIDVAARVIQSLEHGGQPLAAAVPSVKTQIGNDRTGRCPWS